MDIIELTRELGRQLQAEESYIAMRSAQPTCDESEALTEQIGD